MFKWKHMVSWEVKNDKNLLCHLQSGDLGQKYFCCFSVLVCLEKPRFIATKILSCGWNSFPNRLVLRLVKWISGISSKKKDNLFREGIWNYGISIENDYSLTMPFKSSICLMRMKKKAVSHTKNYVRTCFLTSTCHRSCINSLICFSKKLSRIEKEKTLACTEQNGTISARYSMI